MEIDRRAAIIAAARVADTIVEETDRRVAVITAEETDRRAVAMAVVARAAAVMDVEIRTDVAELDVR